MEISQKRKEILNMISHELKTPVVPIIGYCEMLLNPKFGQLNPEQTEAIEEIKKNIHELETMVNDIILQEKAVQQDESSPILPRGLKTPLVPILGYCEMLLNPKFGQLSHDQLEALKEIQQNSIKLNGLINDFWNSQQIELGLMKYFFENIDVDNFIEQIIESLNTLMVKKRIEFSNSIEADLKIKVDRSKLSEIFTNLVENSTVFVPDSGGKIQISAKSQDDHVQFAVNDNGSGIPQDKMDNLFKKFYQLDTSHTRTHGGGGLGLNICRGYIDAMNGKIWVESEEGKGTTFFFTIPKAEGD